MPVNYFDLYQQNRLIPAQPGEAKPTSTPWYAPVTSTASTVLDYVGRPGAALAGGLAGLNDGNALERAWQNLSGQRRDEFDTLLGEDFGMKDSWLRHGLGLAGDMVLDPLNILPVGALAKGVKAVGKVTRADKLGEKVASSAIGRDAAKLFDPLHSLPEELQKKARIFESERRTLPDRNIAVQKQKYGDVSAADRELVLEGLYKGAGKTDEIDDLVLKQRRDNDWLWDEQVRAGVQKDTNYRPDFAPADYTDKYGNKTVQGLQAKLSASNPHARHRTATEEYEDLLKLGGERDIAKAQLMYDTSVGQRILTSDFLKNTVEEYGVPAFAAPAGWRQVKVPAESALKTQLDRFAVPPNVADYLERTIAPKGDKTALGAAYDKGMDLWRTLATVVRPGFHGTNLLGNTWNSYLGGMNPLTSGDAYKKAFDWSRGKMSDVGRFNADQIDDAMHSFGVQGSSFARELGETSPKGALQRALDKQAAGPQGLVDKIGDVVRHPLESARSVGGGIEDFSKRAFFLDRLQKGDSLEDAALATKKFLFDYGELTDFERGTMRRAMPFYTWMRKNLPLQSEMLLHDPSKFAKAAHAFNASEAAAESHGDLVPDGLRPEWMQRTNAVQLPWQSAEGGPSYYLPNLPFQDLNKIPLDNGTSVEGALRDFGSGFAPAFKIPIELALNKSIFTNKPLYNERLGMGDMQKVHPLLQALLPDSVFPVGRGPDKKLQPELPFWMNYGMQQVPLAGAGGKVAGGVSDLLFGAENDAMRSASRPGADIDSFMTGVTEVPQTPAEAALAVQQARKRMSQQRSAQRNEFVQPSRASRLLDEIRSGR